VRLIFESDNPAEIAAVLDRLRSGPATADIGPLAGEQCRRTLCGHPRAVHGAEDFYGRATGVGNGACTLCHNPAKCESFVGAGGS
jgi:hypothetical protein